MQFLVMVETPMTVEMTQQLTKVLEADSGWVSHFIPDNTFLVVVSRGSLSNISSIPGADCYRQYHMQFLIGLRSYRS